MAVGFLVRLKGAWLARKEAGPVPRKAPHYPLVVEILRDHIPPLDVRLRADGIEQLAERIVLLEPSPVPLVEEPRAAQVVLIALRTQLAIEAIEADHQATQRRFSNFSNLYSQLTSAAEQQRLLEDYLAETVTDRRALKADLQALKRDMGIDALRERNAGVAQQFAIMIELGLKFIARAMAAAAGFAQDAPESLRAGPRAEE